MTQLSCENEFCIYQKHGECILQKIKLDIQGNCLECIYVNIEEKALNNIKEKHLKEI